MAATIMALRGPTTAARIIRRAHRFRRRPPALRLRPPRLLLGPGPRRKNAAARRRYRIARSARTLEETWWLAIFQSPVFPNDDQVSLTDSGAAPSSTTKDAVPATLIRSGIRPARS